ncbi:hypothetical protein E3P99_03272 [Wallemia hederae]|uniref:Velvet domain-containing protein n=1 Tax=Wallemia hederae TaxID=1540922 RepID=A0A4T0FHA4_9BASI|nr:hypothetical protein E3P99_03272 [Wallemia hederae]
MRKATINVEDLVTIDKEPRRYELVLLQQGEVARCSPYTDKDRRPVDPPPILRLLVYDKDGRLDDNAARWPYFVLHTSIATYTPSERPLQQSEILQGLLTSSAHYCVSGDAHSSGCYFNLSDISFATIGVFQLKFTLFTVLGMPIAPTETQVLAEVVSKPIRSYTPREFPGMAQSSPLAKSLSERGLIIPVRNEDHRMRAKRDSQREYKEHKDYKNTKT